MFIHFHLVYVRPFLNTILFFGPFWLPLWLIALGSRLLRLIVAPALGAHEHQSSLPHAHTYLCSARFILNITHQHDNDRNLQAVYCHACYLVGPPTFKVNSCYKILRPIHE